MRQAPLRQIAGGMVRRLSALAAVAGLCLALSAPSGLRAAAPTHSPDADLQPVLTQATEDLRAVSQGFRTKEMSDSEIKAKLAAIGPIEDKLATVLADLAPRLQDAEARLAQLGPAPAPPKVEDPQTAQVRKALNRAVGILQADEQQAKLLALEGQQTTDGLTERLRENFQTRLSSQSRSVLDPALWSGLAGALPADLGRLADFVADEAQTAIKAIGDARDLAFIAVGVGLALLLAGPARIVLIRLAYRRAERDAKRTRLTRAALALWRVVVGAGTPLLALIVLHTALFQGEALDDLADAVADLFVRAFAFAAFVDALGRALLSPRRPQWRLAPIDDDLAGRLAPFPALMGGAVGLATFTAGFNAAMEASVSSQMVSDYIAVGLEIAAVAGALLAMSRARAAQSGGQEMAPARAAWVLTALCGWLAVAGAVGSVVIGYLAFGAFLIREAIWGASVLGLLFLLIRFTDEAVPAVLAKRSPLGSALETGLGLPRSTIDQVGVLVSGLARVIFILFAWAAIAAPFGASAGDIFGRVTSAHFTLKLGKAEVSPLALLGAAALFFIGLGITRAVRRWLESRYLPKTQLDVGVRTSLAAGTTYLGALIAILVAFAYLGLSLSQIALFASALSVGIGFGLQSIIGNFVSGLILLAERPVRVGDWVAIGDQQGDVKKISIRATEIELFDRSRLIVPNTDLVTKPVRNVTHSGSVGRVTLVLKVADEADPVEVRDLLLGAISGHADVLKDPEPHVFLTDASGGYLEFTCYAYVLTARKVTPVKSELLLQIIPSLRDKGVSLSTTTTVVNLPAPGAPAAPAPAASASTKPPPTA